MPSTPLLSVRELTKVYPSGVKALANVSFDLLPGEFLVVIGLSGSGKSTLLRCLNRLIEPTSGEIWFQGREIAKIKGSEIRGLRRQMAMIFQQFNLVPRHTVMTNVLMGRLATTSTFASLIGRFPRQDRSDAIRFLDTVGIGNKAQFRADHLSGGEQQRVAIARALAQKPTLLLADEPVASLDPTTCHTVMDQLRKVNQQFGITVLCSLHLLSLVREYATRVIALRAGELVFTGRAEEITESWFKEIYGPDAEQVREK
jgi:phosphonate transport system ATP-binding protein